MTLEEVIKKRKKIDGEFIVAMQLPWSQQAECVLVLPDEDGCMPAETKALGFKNLLSVDEMNEVLEVFGRKRVSDVERARLVMYYAENDAYPDWVYEP
jgi:hypothetical protein